MPTGEADMNIRSNMYDEVDINKEDDRADERFLDGPKKGRRCVRHGSP